MNPKIKYLSIRWHLIERIGFNFLVSAILLNGPLTSNNFPYDGILLGGLDCSCYRFHIIKMNPYQSLLRTLVVWVSVKAFWNIIKMNPKIKYLSIWWHLIERIGFNFLVSAILLNGPLTSNNFPYDGILLGGLDCSCYRFDIIKMNPYQSLMRTLGVWVSMKAFWNIIKMIPEI
jgi:hypothetical protein